MAFGRLERSKAQEPMSQINMTPLVDVMLVLVVIFIVTAPLMASGLKVDLPQTAAAQPAAAAQPLNLSLTADLRIQLGERLIDKAELQRELGRTAETAPQTEIQLRADKTVPYGHVIEIIGIAHLAGLTRIGFVAEPTPNPVRR